MIVAALIVCGLSIVRGFQGQTLMGRPLGGDFVQFYVAGKILNQYEPARMYDLDLEVRLQRSLRGTYLSPLCPAPLPLGECRLARFLAGSLLSRGRFVASISRAFRAAEENRFSAGDILNAVPHGELDRRADFRTRFHCGHAVCVLPRQESQVFPWSRACAGGVQADTHRDPGSDAVLRPALAHAGRGCNRGGGAAPQQIRGCGFVFSFAAGECFDARASSGGCGGLGGARDPGDGVVAVKFMERGLA